MKKKIIIISAIAVVVIGAIIGSTVLLVSLFSAEKNATSSVQEVSGSEDTYAEQKGDAKFTVGTASGAKGDIVKIPVSIDNNPGFIASLMNFQYDNTVVKYIGYEKGDFLTDYEFADNNGVLKFLNLEEGDKDVKNNGLLFNIKFEILKDSAETDIKLNIEDVINYDEQNIKTAVTNGKITAK